jgi:hypothetical protein
VSLLADPKARHHFRSRHEHIFANCIVYPLACDA